ncbi:hypothetical protein Y032_0047g1456 [Ancylostoma ceylanicum]|uniref:Uncharacterized protein n=1 Tax=Ancylostoma ceylanicum TaxID=53326 RepID=A0A016UC30_9BILA|nr:hypothetical protein Y032_0047g1456 [Ancylostoma ceylanicum]
MVCLYRLSASIISWLEEKNRKFGKATSFNHLVVCSWLQNRTTLHSVPSATKSSVSPANVTLILSALYSLHVISLFPRALPFRRMAEAQSQMQSETKSPTTSPPPSRAPPLEAKSPQSPLSRRRSSRMERADTAESSRRASSSGTLPRARRLSKTRKSSLVLPPPVFPESSKLDSKAFRKSSFTTPTASTRRMSRVAPMNTEPTTMDPQKLSPRSSVSTPSSSPNEIPMKFMSIDLERELPEIFRWNCFLTSNVASGLSGIMFCSSTSLNPALQDPDMSAFYSRIKSPPPVYVSRKCKLVCFSLYRAEFLTPLIQT